MKTDTNTQIETTQAVKPAPESRRVRILSINGTQLLLPEETPECFIAEIISLLDRCQEIEGIYRLNEFYYAACGTPGVDYCNEKREIFHSADARRQYLDALDAARKTATASAASEGGAK